MEYQEELKKSIIERNRKASVAYQKALEESINEINKRAGIAYQEALEETSNEINRMANKEYQNALEETINEMILTLKNQANIISFAATSISGNGARMMGEAEIAGLHDVLQSCSIAINGAVSRGDIIYRGKA